MNLGNLWSGDCAVRLGWTVLHSIWQGTVIAAVLAAILSFIPRRFAQARYLVSLIALAAVFGSAVMTFELVAGAPSERAVRSTQIAQPSEPDSLTADSPIRLSAISKAAGKPTLLPGLQSFLWRAAGRLKAALPVIAQLWAMGVLALCCRNLGGWIAAQRLRVIGVHPPDESIRRSALVMAGGLGLRRHVRVLISSIVQTPMVIGWLRPVLLLPAALATGLAPTQIECLLAHELAHIRRHDYLINLLQVLAETLLFYHPAVWWVSRQVRLERERCCDEIAASLIDDRCTYAGSLAALAESPVGARIALAARGSNGGELLRRVRTVLRLEEAAPKRVAPLAIAACLLLFALTIRVSLVRAEPAALVQSAASTTTRPVATLQADCVLSGLVDGKRQVLASPRLNLENDLQTGFLFTGKPPVIIEQNAGQEKGIFGTIRAQTLTGGSLRVICSLDRRTGQAAQPKMNDAELLAKQNALAALGADLDKAQRLYGAALEADRRHKAGGPPYTDEEIARVSPDFANKVAKYDDALFTYQQHLSNYGSSYPATVAAQRSLSWWQQAITKARDDFNQRFFIEESGGVPRAYPSSPDHWREMVDRLSSELDRETRSIKRLVVDGAVHTDQIVKPGEPISLELEDGTRLEVTVHSSDR